MGLDHGQGSVVEVGWLPEFCLVLGQWTGLSFCPVTNDGVWVGQQYVELPWHGWVPLSIRLFGGGGCGGFCALHVHVWEHAWHHSLTVLCVNECLGPALTCFMGE